VDRAPLPPHERSWRHPSEIAAEERAALQAESISTPTRAVAITSGMMGLLAVGLLVFVMSPRQHDQPIAISATTAPDAALRASSPAQASLATAPAAIRTPTAVGRWRGPTERPSAATEVVLATPIGDGHQAVLTRDAVGRVDGGEIEVRLPSGDTLAAEIVAMSDDMVVVALASPVAGHDIADEVPAATDIVTMLASPPVTVAFDHVDEMAQELAVDEGTAVLDDDGDLIALCSRDDDGESATMVDVSRAFEQLDAATTGDR
jgi:hypothetical protein